MKLVVLMYVFYTRSYRIVMNCRSVACKAGQDRIQALGRERVPHTVPSDIETRTMAALAQDERSRVAYGESALPVRRSNPACRRAGQVQ